MHKTWLVARHEFSVTVGRLSYRIFAAAVPALMMLGFVAVAVFTIVHSDDPPDGDAPADPTASAVAVGYVDRTVGEDGGPLFTGFRRQGDATFTPYPDREAAVRAGREGRVDRLFLFPADYLRTGTVVEVKGAGLSERGQIPELRRFIVENLSAGRIGPERIERIVSPYQLATLALDATGAPTDDDDRFVDRIVFVVIGWLLIISAFTAAGYLLQGLSEEKENRIMEVLLSSIKPEHLMFGKLVGLGAAGLLQMGIWTAAGVAFVLALRPLVDYPPELAAAPSPGALLLALTYFLLGYALLGSLQAAIGAVTTNSRAAGNIAAFVILPAMAPLWFVAVLIETPDGTLARILSFIPVTAPVTSLLRLSLGGMPASDVVVSLAGLSLSVGVVVWLATRLFRAYLLTYGQRPRVGDLLLTLRGG